MCSSFLVGIFGGGGGAALPHKGTKGVFKVCLRTVLKATLYADKAARRLTRAYRTKRTVSYAPYGMYVLYKLFVLYVMCALYVLYVLYVL